MPGWTKESLYEHLQDAIDLELWTIPLYLSAMCSIKDKTVDSYHLLRSVVIQEMLHLEIVCNISNAVGYTPQFRPPVYDGTQNIPFHTLNAKAINGPFLAKVGPFDLNAINLFLEIELPKELSADRGVGSKDPLPTYDSIGEFYDSLKYGVQQMWDSCFVPDNGKQKGVFESSYHGFSVEVVSLETAMQGMDAIALQGEGAAAETEVPTQYQPSDDPDDQIGHYERFLKIKHHGLPEIYTEQPGVEATQMQQELNRTFSQLLADFQTSFSSPGPEVKLDAMWPLTEQTNKLWEIGACPEFKVVPLG